MSAMSTAESIQTGDAAAADATADLSDKQHRILAYLREHAAEQTYFKSRLIAEELGLSAKEVGTNMSAVVDAAVDVDVEKWGYSSGTTWMVTR
jgi:DNA-binding MarR family transcriptional regulator